MSRTKFSVRLFYLFLFSLLIWDSAHADVRVGLVMPFTGANAVYGTLAKIGAEAAVSDINRHGGILGQPIRLITMDDASDPKQGVSIANQFALEGIHFVIGGYTSSVAIPASSIYEEGHTIFMSNATHPDFTERGLWNVFRLIGRDEQQAKVAGDYLATHFKNKRIGIVHDRSPYGKGLANELSQVLSSHGIHPVFHDGINPGEKDFSALVSRLKTYHVDLVYYGGFQMEASLIIRQMREQQLNATLMSGDGLVSHEFAAITGPSVEGTLITFLDSPKNSQDFSESLRALRNQGRVLEPQTLLTYASLQVFKEAAERAGVLDSQKIAEIMHSGHIFHTLVGPLSYDKKGDLTNPLFSVHRWSKGQEPGTFAYLPVS
jgi:branched-chain amino acid transport system substrate-binding protein